jgi:serine/threonine protein kinase
MPASGRSPISPENNESNSRRTLRNSSKNGKGRSSARLEVLDRIGEGSLWIVYRVRERGVPGSPIRALKALKNAPNRHPRLPEKLFSCTLAWQNLSHPMVAQPFEVGTEEGTLFQTMELLSGGSLESRLGKNSMPADAALNIIRQIASGLAYLHEKNIFHGDLRPAQILFDSTETPKITDGGVAEGFAQSGLALADVQGEVAYYLAPERTQGAPFSAASDVYSLGITFYRMLTGRVPFDGASTLSISARHRTDLPVPPSQLRPKISAEIEKIVLQMLEKDPADRPSAAQIAGATHSTNAAVTLLAPHTITALSQVADTADSPSNITEDSDIPKLSPNNTPTKRKPVNDPVVKPGDDKTKAKPQISTAMAKKRHIRREFWGFVGACVWLLVLMGIGGGMAYGAYYYWVSESPKEVVVPKYIGLDQEKAKAVLASKGLYIKVVRESYDPKVPAGTVLQGEPEEGRTVRSKREVSVTVSAGRSPIKMVDFSRLTLNQARQIIVKHGLRLGSVVQQYHPTIPDTFICGQYPDPGSPLRRSEPITLIVSRGAQPTEIDGTRDSSNEPLDPVTTAGGDSSMGLQEDFTPLEALPDTTGNTQGAEKLKVAKAVISVQVPNGEAQNVRILVRDSLGERTVFQEVKRGGSQVKAEVTATKTNNEVCLVRVYIGEELVREQEF